jgi:hypothetical protein
MIQKSLDQYNKYENILHQGINPPPRVASPVHLRLVVTIIAVAAGLATIGVDISVTLRGSLCSLVDALQFKISDIYSTW